MLLSLSQGRILAGLNNSFKGTLHACAVSSVTVSALLMDVSFPHAHSFLSIHLQIYGFLTCQIGVAVEEVTVIEMGGRSGHV